MEKPNIRIQPELNIDTGVYNTSFYKVQKISAQNGADPTLGGWSQTSQFEIPCGNVINLSKLRLGFLRGECKNAADGNALNAKADTFYLLPTDHFQYINKIELYTSTNVVLVDINFCDVYNKLACPTVINYRKRTDIDGFIIPSYRSTMTVTPATGDCSIDQALGVINMDDISYNFAGAVAANITTKYHNILLSEAFPDTIFNVNRDIYVWKTLYLRITWNPTNRIGGCAKADLTGQSNLVGLADAVVNIPITKLTLSIYSQANPDINSLIKWSANKMQELFVPFIQWNWVILTGDYQATSVKIVSNNPRSKLFKTYCGLMKADAVGLQKRFNNLTGVNACGGAVWTSGRLYINSDMILDLDSTKGEDFKHVVTQHKNHSFKTRQTFYHFSPFCNVFDTHPLDEVTEIYDNTLKGYNFSSGSEIAINHQFNCVAAQYTHYIFAVIIQPIYLKDGDISLSPFL